MSEPSTKKDDRVNVKRLSDLELFRLLFTCCGNDALRPLDKLPSNSSLRDITETMTSITHSHCVSQSLSLINEFQRRYLSQGLQRSQQFLDPDEVKTYLRAELSQRRRERFIALFLDNQHRLIQCRVLFKGTIDSANVHPREVVRVALDLNAAAVIFAHNHPSGVAEPSDADRRITDRLINALSLIDIRVLDHFVVGDRDVISFAQRGWV